MSEASLDDLESVARAMRRSLASLRAAAETLELLPAMEAAHRVRLHGVVGEEAERLGRLVARLESLAPRGSGERSRLAAGELPELMTRAMEERGLEVRPADGPALALGDAELSIDRRRLRDATLDLASSMRRDFAVLRSTLGAQSIDAHLLLDWSWPVEPADVEPVQAWQGDALDASLRPAVRAHDGEAWFDLERASGDEPARAHVRLLLPLADARFEEA